MRTLTVGLGARSYDIQIGEGLLTGAAIQVAPTRRALVVSDEHVAPLYAGPLMAALGRQGIEAGLHVVPAGEESKSLGQLEGVYRALVDCGVTRSDLVVALGGGVVGDLAGYAAATYLRGVRYQQIPTTLLAQVDSAVGGKTAIDLPSGKNLVGAFHQPSLVLIDLNTLRTLDDRTFVGGMGEVIKYGLAFDAGIIDLIGDCRKTAERNMEEIVVRCLDIKRRVVQNDERDVGERMLLNFGHTIGHAIESAEHYEGLSHGEAVAAGMHLMARLGESIGLTQPGTAQRVRQILGAWGLPTTCDRALWDDMRRAFTRDKKHIGGALKVVMLKRLGEAFLYDVEVQALEEVREWLR